MPLEGLRRLEQPGGLERWKNGILELWDQKKRGEWWERGVLRSLRPAVILSFHFSSCRQLYRKSNALSRTGETGEKIEKKKSEKWSIGASECWNGLVIVTIADLLIAEICYNTPFSEELCAHNFAVLG